MSCSSSWLKRSRFYGVPSTPRSSHPSMHRAAEQHRRPANTSNRARASKAGKSRRAEPYNAVQLRLATNRPQKNGISLLCFQITIRPRLLPSTSNLKRFVVPALELLFLSPEKQHAVSPGQSKGNPSAYCCAGLERLCVAQNPMLLCMKNESPIRHLQP